MVIPPYKGGNKGGVVPPKKGGIKEGCLRHVKENLLQPKLKALSRKLRRKGTLYEVLLWMQIKGGQIEGYKFTRQKPIGNYMGGFLLQQTPFGD
ncbi:DUF559 domain-containing protein [candidate division KSB1 bacterium]|nr:DUF559 domain-containing protein [candidate division KSB1 bacterium]